MKTDIREYNDQELDMIVQNDEYYYTAFLRAVRYNSIEAFIEELREEFIFNDDQEEELRTSFISEQSL